MREFYLHKKYQQKNTVDVTHMKYLILPILIIIILPNSVNAAMDPALKDCLERGYYTESDTDTTYCVFPDASRCPLRDFNDGSCGREYMTEYYCVGENMPVWDKDKCCEGLEPYLKPNHIGQSHCKNINILGKISDQLKYNTNMFLRITIFTIVLLLGSLVYFINKKKNNR